MQRPADTQKCNACPHPFGAHYTSYDGKKGGCSHYDDFQRDGGPCNCKGFTMAWQPGGQSRE